VKPLLIQVTTIKITLYRLAKNSQIISSLINAAKNGKKVIVQIELQARFDEASNISYAEQMQTEGIELIFGVKGLKVHSKMCVIERIEGGKVKDMVLYQLEILMKLLQRYILMSHYLQAISKF
jgi:polyphosphate kinase